MPKLNLAHIHLHQQPDGTREICVAPEYLAHGAQAAAYYQARDTTPVALRITTAFLPFEQRQHENQSAENLNFAALAHCPALQRLSFSEYRARQYSNLAALYALRHLTHLTLPHQSQPKIDLAQFPQLRELSCAGKGNAHNLSQAASLQRLYLFSFKDKDLSALGSLKNLQQLTLIRPAIETLNGLTELLQLETLDIAYARKLHDISALQQCPWLKSVALPAKFQG